MHVGLMFGNPKAMVTPPQNSRHPCLQAIKRNLGRLLLIIKEPFLRHLYVKHVRYKDSIEHIFYEKGWKNIPGHIIPFRVVSKYFIKKIIAYLPF